MVPRRFGLIHVYTGNGKGKTTAAMGLVLRAVGQGFKAYVIQFLKGGAYTGEFISLNNFLPMEKAGITQFGKRCVKELKQLKLIGLEKGFEKQDCKYFDYIRDNIDCGECRQCFIDDEEQKKQVREAFKKAQEVLSSDDYDLIVLDELNYAIHKNYVTLGEVIELLQKKAPHIELVITGRHAPQMVIEMADLVTEMKEIKHYYGDGVVARRGIEY